MACKIGVSIFGIVARIIFDFVEAKEERARIKTSSCIE